VQACNGPGGSQVVREEDILALRKRKSLRKKKKGLARPKEKITLGVQGGELRRRVLGSNGYGKGAKLWGSFKQLSASPWVASVGGGRDSKTTLGSMRRKEYRNSRGDTRTWEKK